MSNFDFPSFFVNLNYSKMSKISRMPQMLPIIIRNLSDYDFKLVNLKPSVYYDIVQLLNLFYYSKLIY